jgi:asparagine synthase (glutamine-hydrolysing)
MSGFVAEISRGDGPVRATGIVEPRGRSWIVGDVRLDARDALRDALGAAGIATADSASDTDLVLAAWTAWRATASERLIGDFSFAIWDERDRTFFCARDPLGVRPLYWTCDGRSFVCGSVLEGVRAHPSVSSRLNERAIVSFLRYGYNDDRSTTSFADIQRLEPGHHLVVRDDRAVPAPRRYWSFPAPETLRLKRDEEYLERYREVLDAAILDRLRAGRSAILLSGGLDSTTLAATAHRGAPSARLRAWTFDRGPAQPRDELRLAAAVAARLELRHDIIRDAAAPLAHLADRTFRSPEPVDEPAWSSWRGHLARIGSDARVLVVGDDGDALFRPPGLFTMLRRNSPVRVVRDIFAYSVGHRRLPHLGLRLRERLAAPFGMRQEPAPGWIRPELLARGHEPRRPREPRHATRPEAASRLGDAVWQSVLEPARPEYTGIELDIVWPLLDTRVIEFVFSIPPVPWCQRKELARRAFCDALPDEVLSRRKSPLSGFYEAQVASWRSATRSFSHAFGEEVREFVDTRSVTDTLKTGSVPSVLAAWRALALDQWLRSAARPRTE